MMKTFGYGAHIAKLSGLLFILLIGHARGAEKPSLAIVDFEGFGISPTEAIGLTNRLRNEIFRQGHYHVVDRGMMQSILEEQDFQLSGCTSNECLVEVGQLVGAQQMIGGSITKIGTIYTVSARLVDVSTGRIIYVSDYDLSGGLEELLTEGMKQVATMFSPLSARIEDLRREERIVSDGVVQPKFSDLAHQDDTGKVNRDSLLQLAYLSENQTKSVEPNSGPEHNSISPNNNYSRFGFTAFSLGMRRYQYEIGNFRYYLPHILEGGFRPYIESGGYFIRKSTLRKFSRAIYAGLGLEKPFASGNSWNSSYNFSIGIGTARFSSPWLISIGVQTSYKPQKLPSPTLQFLVAWKPGLGFLPMFTIGIKGSYRR